MNIKDHYFIGITEETNFLVSHLYSSMMNLSQLFYCVVEFFSAEFYLGISHLDWSQLLSLAVQLLLLTLEVVQSIADIASFDLFSSEILYFTCSLLNIILAELNQTQMFVKIFLLSQQSCLLNFKGI